MTIERDLLERIVSNVLRRRHTGIMGAADDYAAAERLDEHIKMCHKVFVMTWITCGDGWFCDKAPTKKNTA